MVTDLKCTCHFLECYVHSEIILINHDDHDLFIIKDEFTLALNTFYNTWQNPIHHEHISPPEQLGRVAWELQKELAAAYALQGRRPHMEDRFNIVSDLEQTGIYLFGIFDGHGGEVYILSIQVQRLFLLL